jgi:hypothetical protein
VTAPCTPPEDCLLLACDVAVRRALELASKRMLTREHLRDQRLRELPQYLVYTRLSVQTCRYSIEYLVGGAWAGLPDGLTSSPGLIDALDDYVRSLLLSAQTHQPEYLREIVRSQL